MRAPIFIKRILILVLMVLMVVSPFFLNSFSPQIAHAQYNPEEEAVAGGAACALSALIIQALALLGAFGVEVPVGEFGNRYKENLLDCAAWVVNNIIINTIIIEITNWINEGLDGNSFYVKNLGGHLGSYADELAGRFIDAYGLAEYVCSPFKLQVQRSLAVNRLGFERRATCTLTSALNNIDDFGVFVSGDFSQGGWSGWYDLTTHSQNNPYGAYLLADAELKKGLRERVDLEKRELDFGSGFQALKKCEDIEVQADGPPNPDGTFPTRIEENCTVRTPGASISTQFSNTTDLGNQRLLMADELGEVLTGALTQWLLQSFAGPEGVAGFDPDNIVPLGEYDPGDILPPVPGLGNIDNTCQADLGPGTSVVSRSFLQQPYEVPYGEVGTLPKDQRFSVPLTGHYPEMEFDIDFKTSPQWQPEPYDQFISIVSIRNEGGDRTVPDPAIHANIAGPRNPERNKVTLSFQHAPWGTGYNTLIRTPLGRRLPLDSWYHAHLTYNAYENKSIIEITEGKGRSGSLVSRSVAPATHSFFPQRNGMRIILSGENLDENLARHEGAQYQNLEVTFTPGEPICRGLGTGRPRVGDGAIPQP